MNKKVKLLIAIVSCYPDKVQTYLESNYDKLKSDKYDIVIAINWNNIDEVPNMSYKDLVVENYRTVDIYPNYPDKSGSQWNIARFTNVDNIDFDYIIVQDDDILYKTHIDNLLDEVTEKKVDGLVLLQGRSLRPYKTYDVSKEIDKLNDRYVIRKRHKSTPTYAGNQGGQLMSRKFFLENYKTFLMYNGHGEDCIRSGVAFSQDKFYATAGNVLLGYYDFKGYPKELQVRSAYEASKLKLFPVMIKWNTEWYPLDSHLDLSKLVKIDDNLYAPDELTKNKIINLYGEQLK